MKKLVSILLCSMGIMIMGLHGASASTTVMTKLAMKSRTVYVVYNFRNYREFVLSLQMINPSAVSVYSTLTETSSCSEAMQQLNNNIQKVDKILENKPQAYLIMKAFFKLYPNYSYDKNSWCLNNTALSKYVKTKKIAKVFYVKIRKNKLQNMKPYNSITQCESQHKTGCALIVNVSSLFDTALRGMKTGKNPLLNNMNAQTNITLLTSSILGPMLMDVAYGNISKSSLMNLIITINAYANT